MVVVRIIVKIVLLPVRICLTMIQLVVMFFTWLVGKLERRLRVSER